MKIEIIRTYYSQSFTKGVMLVNNRILGYTLEPQIKGSNETSHLSVYVDI